MTVLSSHHYSTVGEEWGEHSDSIGRRRQRLPGLTASPLRKTPSVDRGTRKPAVHQRHTDVGTRAPCNQNTLARAASHFKVVSLDVILTADTQGVSTALLSG